MKKALGKLKILFWLFRSLNFGTPVSQDDNGILEVFGPENTLIQGFLLELMSWSSVCDPGLMICLFLRIPGVTFASKVEICKLVMFCPKYLIWCQVLFLNLMQRPEKLFHNVILVIFSLKNVNRTPYLEGNISSYPNFFVKPCSNLLSWVNFPSWDRSVVGR